MWPFKKKTVKIPELPTLPTANTEPIEKMQIQTEPLKEIEEQIPDELPSLEFEEMPITEEILHKGDGEVNSVETRNLSKVHTMTFGNKFVKTDDFKNLLSLVNEINSDFEQIDSDISRTILARNSRHEKMEKMQDSLEDTGKKLMEIDNMLFGG